eukprot:Gb_03039 [translate_table: standard]
MAPGGVVSVAKQAELLKQDGNNYFKKDRLGAAIEAYTQAITLCPNVPVYWTNRALCHRKRDDWGKVESDCRKALELDNNSVKLLLTLHHLTPLNHYNRKPYMDRKQSPKVPGVQLVLQRGSWVVNAPALCLMVLLPGFELSVISRHQV